MARASAVEEIEELPEADRLEGFPHPRNTRRLFGHAGAERTLAEAFASGRMHHAWILAGSEGIGKATLAYRFACFVLADAVARGLMADSLDVDAEGTAARQVRALSHPGLLVVRRAFDLKTKRLPAMIAVDEVRRLKPFLGRSADAGAWRVVIVDRADELNPTAANALLKSLEEPPPRTVFLLIAATPARLLTTIRSRCRVLDLAPLAEDDLKRAATQAIVATDGEVAVPTPSEWERLVALSGGSVRRLLFLHAAGGLELNARLDALLGKLPKVDWGAVHALGDELAGAAADQRFALFLELTMDRLAGLIRARATEAGTGPEAALAKRLIGEGALASWAGLWERVAAEKADAAALNLDRKALILDIFSRIAAAAR